MITFSEKLETCHVVWKPDELISVRRWRGDVNSLIRAKVHAVRVFSLDAFGL